MNVPLALGALIEIALALAFFFAVVRAGDALAEHFRGRP